MKNPDAIKNEKLRGKIKAGIEQLVQNREMVRLDLDLPLPLPIRDLKIQPRWEELIAELERCEFKTLTQEVRAEAEKFLAQNSAAEQGTLF